MAGEGRDIERALQGIITRQDTVGRVSQAEPSCRRSGCSITGRGGRESGVQLTRRALGTRSGVHRGTSSLRMLRAQTLKPTLLSADTTHINTRNRVAAIDQYPTRIRPLQATTGVATCFSQRRAF